MRKHLTECQRTQIESFIETGISQKWIANRLRVSSSTISREIKRNGTRGGYVATEAKVKAIAKAVERRSAASRSTKHMVPGIVEEIELRIRDTQSPHWSPAQIAGFLKERGTLISFGTIQRHIRVDRKRGDT